MIADLEAARKPDLQGTIEWGWAHQRVPHRTADIFFVVSIRNLGMPSSIEAWSLDVKTARRYGEGVSGIRPQRIPGSLTFEDLCIFSSDDLFSRTEAMRTGIVERGIVYFLTDKVIPESIEGAQFILTYKDVSGREYATPPYSLPRNKVVIRSQELNP